MSAPTVTPELRALLRRVKLGRCLDTLPERLTLAQTGGMGHAEFLELVLADEVTRRETTSADRRARAAGLDPTMTLDRWDDTAKVTYDHAVWNELCSLRFVDGGHNAVIMGPVGVGKTFLATALGHAAVRRRYSVHFERCDRLLKRLRASRLDNSHDTEMRKLLRVDLLIIDDFALQPLDPLDTADVYELIVERHRAAGHRRDLEPRADRVARPDGRPAPRPVRHRPAPVRRPRTRPRRRVLPATPEAHRHRPTTRLTPPHQPRDHPAADVDTPTKWSHATGARVVPSSWRTTFGELHSSGHDRGVTWATHGPHPPAD